MFHSFKSKRQHPAIPNPLFKFCFTRGYPNFHTKSWDSFFKKDKFSVKMKPQMVLSTEYNYYTNIISLVMLLVAPISGLTVKISRFSKDPTIAYIHQHLFINYYFQAEHCYDTPQNIHIPAFVYLVCFYSQIILQSDHFHGIIIRPVLCSALYYFQCLH